MPHILIKYIITIGLLHKICLGRISYYMSCTIVVQSLGCIQLFVISWTAACQAYLYITTPRVYSNSCPLNQWCHPTISSSVAFFSFYLQPLPASGSFPVTWFFTSGVQNIEVSASASILPMNDQYNFSKFRNGPRGSCLITEKRCFKEYKIPQI